MIPEFPLFKPLEIEDRADIEGFLKEFPPYSDFNFFSLWCWNVGGYFMVSKLNGNLIVRFADYITSDFFYSFIGSKKTEDTINVLLKFSHEKLGLNYLRMVPARSLGKIMNKDEYSITEERGAFDYVYDLSEIYKYKGGSLKQKRRLVSNFIKKNDDIVVSNLDLQDVPTQNAIIDIARDLVGGEGDTVHDSHEVIALKRFMELSNTINQTNIIPLGVYVSGRLIIFNFTEIVHDYWAIVHFEKANFSLYPEAGAYIFYELMEIMKAKNVLYVNLEQDLGINGLRANKMSYRPTGFLKKYKINQR